MAASIGSSKKLDRASAAFSSQSRSANIQNIKKSLLQATDEELYKCAVALQTGFFKSEQKEDTGRFHHGVVCFKDVPKRDIGILLLDVLRPPTVAKLDEAADDALRSAFCVIYGVDLSWKVPSKVVATFMEKLRERRLNLGNRACSNDFWHFKECGSVDWVRSGAFQFLPPKVGVSAEVHKYTHLRYVGHNVDIDISSRGITADHWEFHDMHIDSKACCECVRGDSEGSKIKLITKFARVSRNYNEVSQPMAVVDGPDETATPDSGKKRARSAGASETTGAGSAAEGSVEGPGANSAVGIVANLTSEECLSMFSSRRRRRAKVTIT